MKKKVWLLGVAVAALTSCAENEVLEIPESRTIGFDTFVEKPTRAVDDVKDGAAQSFKNFIVYGAVGEKTGTSGAFVEQKYNEKSYMNAVSVKGGYNNWSYTPHQPWLPGKTFRFAAYADGNADPYDTAQGAVTSAAIESPASVTFYSSINYESNEKWGLSFTNYTVTDKDLVVAIPAERSVPDPLTTHQPAVTLNFKHVLSKIVFEFTYVKDSDAPDNAILEIEPFTFKAAKTGNCSTYFMPTEIDQNLEPLVSVWTPEELPQGGYTYEYKLFQQKDGVNQTWRQGKMVDEIYVLPQKNMIGDYNEANGEVTNVSYQITIDRITIHTKTENGTILNTDYFDNVTLGIPAHQEWKPGYLYRYTADLNPEQHLIHFNTNVAIWVDEPSRDQEVGDNSAYPIVSVN